jgi:hypothetical protein
MTAIVCKVCVFWELWSSFEMTFFQNMGSASNELQQSHEAHNFLQQRCAACSVVVILRGWKHMERPHAAMHVGS